MYEAGEGRGHSEIPKIVEISAKFFLKGLQIPAKKIVGKKCGVSPLNPNGPHTLMLVRVTLICPYKTYLNTAGIFGKFRSMIVAVR